MRLCSAVVAGIVASAFTVLTTMAFASPPDPIWIAGFWDDADYDDVVILVASASGVVEPDSFVRAVPLLATTTPVARLVEDSASPFVPNSHRPRDPPA